MSLLPFASWFPFAGLPLFFEVLFSVAFVIILGMLVWTSVLFARGLRADRDMSEVGGQDDFEWIFMVPALNEEVTIRDSIERLEQIELAKKRIVVINDGSDDGTAEILAGIENPDLAVIERVAPDARRGKAAALNYAYAQILERFEPDPERTIICIVDADGRISPESPGFIAHHFQDPQVGGVQSLVRIYNRHRFLTWFQDVEFSIYGHLFQAGRNRWGTAGMGGNGQYNRLAALASIDDSKAEDPDMRPGSAGPWRDRLTEDQDLGLRLLLAGWHSHQDNRAMVDQQGLSNLGRLFKRRDVQLGEVGVDETDALGAGHEPAQARPRRRYALPCDGGLPVARQSGAVGQQPERAARQHRTAPGGLHRGRGQQRTHHQQRGPGQAGPHRAAARPAGWRAAAA